MKEPKAATLFESTGVRSATGVLPSQELQAFIAQGVIAADVPVAEGQIQPASMDLRLGPKAWRVAASFLPGAKSTVRKKIDELKVYDLDLSTPKVLEKGSIYIVQLMESVKLPPNFYGRSSPKSTTGRLDLFTRLITDHCIEYEFVEDRYAGALYLEIVPIHFSVVVRAGTSLNQLRIIHGTPSSPDVDESDTKIEDLDRREKLVYDENSSAHKAKIWDGLMLTIDLAGRTPGDVVGFKARPNTTPIDLALKAHYEAADFWEPIHGGPDKPLILHPDDFYILASKERVRVPHDYAGRLIEIDPSYGEFRVHYAGFFDPGFGYGNNDVLGTRAVLEVRAHEVPFQMEDGQVVGRLKYEKLVAPPAKIYGLDIGSSYQSQGVALSKQFKPFKRKITRVTPLVVNGGYVNWVFVKVETSVPGLIGWGESSLEWKTNGVVGVINDLTPLLIGQDPRRIEHVWQLMWRGGFYRGGITHTSAMSGIDMACWDILGKSLNKPVYQLLGGAVRDRVRCYGHMVGDGKKRKKPLSAPELAKASLQFGLTALKCGPSGYHRPVEGLAAVKRVEAEITAIRRTIGDHVDLMVDLHGRCTPANGARYGRALEGLGLLFLEEPCLPYSVSGMKHVADHVQIPIATGERLSTRFEFAPLFEARAAEVYQPDPAHTGGISEVRKIAAMAEPYYASIAPHNPLGPINTQACLQLGMAIPNFLIQEVLQVKSHWRHEVASPAIAIVDGHAHPGDRPGMGLTINERECAKHPYKETRQPAAFHADGSVADW